MENTSSAILYLRHYLTLKNYRKATIESYTTSFGQFLKWRNKNGISYNDYDEIHIKNYLLYRFEKGLKWSTINCDYSSIMHYYVNVLKLKWNVENLPRPRYEKGLPRIVSKQVINALINSASNLKHQAFMSLLYGTGIRLNEALALKVNDIDGDRKQLLVKNGKGAKDRYVDVPDCLLVLLRHYYKLYRPNVYLFNGAIKTESYSATSARRLIEKAAKNINLQKHISPHVFRHCYATHHIESGTDLVYIKKQLGHSNIKTTAKYIHLVKQFSWRVKHPIASMQIKYSQQIR